MSTELDQARDNFARNLKHFENRIQALAAADSELEQLENTVRVAVSNSQDRDLINAAYNTQETARAVRKALCNEVDGTRKYLKDVYENAVKDSLPQPID